LIAPLPKLKYFEGMKMMNDMMNMNGTMKDMGMNMSLQKMDMNTVMYPEISGDAAMKMDMKSNGVKMKMDMKEPKMDHSTHAMVSPDIETLNYSMLKLQRLPRFHKTLQYENCVLN
jgi:hypothetical protein